MCCLGKGVAAIAGQLLVPSSRAAHGRVVLQVLVVCSAHSSLPEDLVTIMCKTFPVAVFVALSTLQATFLTPVAAVVC